MKTKLHFLLLLTMAFALVACGPPDPRRKLFSEDEDKLGKTNFTGDNPLTTTLEEYIFDNTNPKLHPEDFSYYTRISEDGQKILVLIQMPKLKKAEKNSRSEVADMVMEWQADNDEVSDKELYLGVKGRVTWMIIKRPGEEAKNSLLAIENDLYDFYGPREAFETEEAK